MSDSLNTEHAPSILDMPSRLGAVSASTNLILVLALNPCPLPDVAKNNVGSPGKGPMTQFPSGESVYLQ